MAEELHKVSAQLIGAYAALHIAGHFAPRVAWPVMLVFFAPCHGLLLRVLYMHLRSALHRSMRQAAYPSVTRIP